MKVELTKEDINILIQLLGQVNVKLDQATILIELKNKLMNVK